MKTLDSIPTNKIERASKLVSTGIKVGGNYIRYYGKKIITGDDNKTKLNENNAKDIYDGLKQLKGSALKVAQMLSMEKIYCLKRMLSNLAWLNFLFPLYLLL